MRVSKEKAVELATQRLEKVQKYFNRAEGKLAEATAKLAQAQFKLAESKVVATEAKTLTEEVISVPTVSEFA